MHGAPVGREAEWDRLMARLEARRAALVLVAGPPGSGRTHLLNAVGGAARALGYSAIGCDDPVSLEPTTRSSDVRRIIASLLGRSEQTLGESKPAALGFLRRFARRIMGPARDERAVLRMMEAAAPVVLAIDGYAAGDTLSAWFADELIPRILRSVAPIVVLVVDNLGSMAGLRDKAAEVIELGPVDREAVGQHLRAAGTGLQPPLSDDEVEAYCDAVADDLGVLTPLEEVLAALRTEL